MSVAMNATTRSMRTMASRTIGIRSLSSKPPIIRPVTYVERRDGEVGPGGRSSSAGIKVAVFGGSGFLARYVCECLGSTGTLTYLGNRGDEFDMRWLRPLFKLGGSRFVFYSPRDRDSIAEVIADADIVINLIGKYFETSALTTTDHFPYLRLKTNFSFHDTNVDLCRTIAEVCKELQVDNLIHMSSLAASPNSNSEWARTKYLGELAVKEVFPWVTIIRPTQLFGHRDRLLNWFAMAARGYPGRVVPMFDQGQALTQPVYVNDVAKAILRVVDDPESFEGKTLDCFGPRDFTYRELAEFVFDITGQNARLVDVTKSMGLMLGKVQQFTGTSGPPFLTPDLVELWCEDYVPGMSQEEYDDQPVEGRILTLKDLGIEATPVEKVAFDYLHRFRKGGHFQFVSGYHGNEE